jgi:transmembrane sensor
MDNLYDIENYNWELLAKYLCNEASEQERQEVETWAGQSGVNLAEINENRELLEKAKLWFETRRFNTHEAWDKVTLKLEESSRVIQMQPSPQNNLFYRKMLRVAASILLAVALGTAGYFVGFRQQEPAIYSEVITNDKQVVNGIILPDGSVVTLNRNSKLTFSRSFSGNIREVSITGEGFFEVKPDASRPFVITAGNAQIKVLGTSFNVCAYPEEETVDVVVETGKVQVTCGVISKTPSYNLILSPGEKGTVSKKDLTLEKSLNADRNITAWRTRQFVFDETPLSDVIATLEKVYFTNIQIVDPAINDLVLTASFNDQPVEFILDVIRLTFNLEFTAMNGQYFLTSINNR